MSSIILPNSQINNIKMIIFDKDGTLIDIHHYWCSMIEYRAEFFINSLNITNKEKIYAELIDKMGIDLSTKKMKPEGPVGIKPRGFIIETALNTILQYDNSYTKEMVEKIFNDVDLYSKTKLKDIVKILPGVKKLLNILKDTNIKISIATTDLTNRAILAMESLLIDDFFINIAGADLVKNAKPSPDLVNYLLKKNNLLNNEVIVIGDSMADLNMSKNAQVKFIGVKTGLYTNEFIQNSQYIIEDLNMIKVK